MLWKEQGRLEAHRESLKEQREVFELEKQKHMEAVRRLDREVRVDAHGIYPMTQLCSSWQVLETTYKET